MIIVGEQPSYHHKIKITGTVSTACSGEITGNVIAYNTINGNKIQITEPTPFSFTYEFLGAPIDENPPTISLLNDQVNFYTIKDYPYEEKELSSLVNVGNGTNITSTWLTYQLKEFDTTENEYKAINSFNGFSIENGRTTGIGETYSDYAETKYIEFTLHYIKNGLEYELDPILQKISILVGAYIVIDNSGWSANEEFPAIFKAANMDGFDPLDLWNPADNVYLEYNRTANRWELSVFRDSFKTIVAYCDNIYNTYNNDSSIRFTTIESDEFMGWYLTGKIKQKNYYINSISDGTPSNILRNI
jgi:hypothetical protein